MSNQLDDRIRDLYAELADSAPRLPPLPPLTAPEKVSSPWVRRWPVLVAAATATIVIIAAGPLLLGGGVFGTGDEASDTTSIAAAETTEAPTTTAAEGATETTTVAAETTEAPSTTVSTGSPFLDAVQSTTVSTEPVTLPADVLAAADGLVVGALVEFVWPDDGSTGHEFVVMVVDNGAATMILGRDCRVESGSPPFAETGGGVIVHGQEGPDISDVRRCTPGEEVEPLAEDGQAMTTALIDGRPVVAIGTESSISVLDLDSGATDILATFDPSVETPTAASYGDGMWVISSLAAGEPFNAGGPTRYVFLDATGARLDVAGNPAPDFSAVTATYRMAALTPNGSELVFVEQFADLSADVVVWDLAAGVEIERYRVIEPFTTPADDAGGGQRFVGSLDASDTEILVNVNIAFGAVAPGGIVRIDRTDGSATDVVSSTEGIDFQVASFLDRP